ncbi:hypothetical protein MHM582_3248 [Microbacterium sp. HM58-2]|nr:hypothetical protein MHM582_3248 [Microbacterium sp. HM58-2]
MSAVEHLKIAVPAGLWTRVDSCVDNTMATDVVELNMESVINGACVRDVGWRASAAFDGERDEWGLPPLDHLLPVVLQRSHWEWTIEQLDRWMMYESDKTLVRARPRPQRPPLTLTPRESSPVVSLERREESHTVGHSIASHADPSGAWAHEGTASPCFT